MYFDVPPRPGSAMRANVGWWWTVFGFSSTDPALVLRSREIRCLIRHQPMPRIAGQRPALPGRGPSAGRGPRQRDGDPVRELAERAYGRSLAAIRAPAREGRVVSDRPTRPGRRRGACSPTATSTACCCARCTGGGGRVSALCGARAGLRDRGRAGAHVHRLGQRMGTRAARATGIRPSRRRSAPSSRRARRCR